MRQRAEFLGPKGAFCASGKGGCGWPRGSKNGTPISYGEWRERQSKQSGFTNLEET